LIIIVAVAAFTPCCNEDECQDEIAATSKQDHSKSEGGDNCSPFFACTGCPGFTLVEKPISFPAPAEYYPQYFDADFNFMLSAYAISPWQPPRTV
jgi:hypothetical protein